MSAANMQNNQNFSRQGNKAERARADNIIVEKVGLTFSNGFVGLKETSLAIPGGAFCTLLGPSGSGKTTLLRAIAGLATPTSGRIFIGGKDVTDLPVQARNIGFVFQNYALFPHMSVAENIAYPLKLHKWDAAARTERVAEILALIELRHAADRAVGELSGGQQQRVAIGRALAYKPSLLLLDEPMGALDRRLRQQLGAQLREIQQQTGITTVYVTHDQEEAFILSDKIAIMDQGEILQFDAPEPLYFQPETRFVAQFLGEVNLVEVSGIDTASPERPRALTEIGPVAITSADVASGNANGFSLTIRPEEILFSDDASGEDDFVEPVPVSFVRELFLGSRCLVTVRHSNGKELLVECPRSKKAAAGSAMWITWRRSAAVLVRN